MTLEYLGANVLYSTFPTVSQSVQSLSRVRLFATPWIEAGQASLSITNSRSWLKPMSIKSVMPSNHLILCRPLRLLPLIPPSIRVFSNESTLHMRWPKYWSFSFSISTSNEHQDWSPLGWTGWSSLQSKGLSRVFSNTIVQKPSIFRRSAFLTVQLFTILFLKKMFAPGSDLFRFNHFSGALRLF